MITFAHDHLGRRVHIDETGDGDYFCPVCGSPLVTRRGIVRRHHFAHRAEHRCTDSWRGTYADTEWHFTWQERYPEQNREITLRLGGVAHRADVLVGDTIVEFQHSALSPSQFNDRNAFYADLGYKVIWLYDLREPFASGAIVESHPKSKAFRWQNPRESFNSYDIATGDADLFFQLRDDDGGPCIVHVSSRGATGFDEFTARRWMTSEQFLAFTGHVEDSCPAPCLTPLEPNEDYGRFKERYGIMLNPQQERAVQAVDGATLLLAVPGSGKTTVMVARIGYLVLERGVPPESIMAITYNRAAAIEMRERFASQFGDRELAGRIGFRTINSLCDGICREWHSAHRSTMPKVIGDAQRKRLLRDLLRNATGEWPSEWERIQADNAITFLKNNKISDTETIRGFESEIPHLCEVYERYQAHLMSNGLIDYDDQMVLAERLLKNPGYLESWRSRYRYWCVDEAQDTSLLQHVLIYNLSSRDGAGNIFIVGDEDQSIYGFRGARPTALLNFKFNYRNAHVLKLERNYRSGEEIVGAASSFVGRCKGRFEKRMTSERGPGSIVRVYEVPTRMEQYERACALIETHGTKGTLAVIYRDNESGIPLVDRLEREGVSYRLQTKSNTFFTSSVVLDIKAFMELAINPRDERAFDRIWAKAGCYIRRDDAKYTKISARRDGTTIPEALIKQMSTYRKGDARHLAGENARRFADLVKDVASLPPHKAIDRIMGEGYREWLTDKGMGCHKVSILRDIATREDTIGSFFERLRRIDELCGRDPSDWKEAGTILSTAHSSKGREFDSVIILDAVGGTFPTEHAGMLDGSKDSASGYQEERRLFYVAMTRARDELILMRPLAEETPFVDEVVPRMPAPSRRPRRPRPKSAPPHPIVMAPDVDAMKARRKTRCVTDGQLRPPASKARDDSPYDIRSWKVIERHGAQRLVEKGAMQAVITDDVGTCCADMDVPLEKALLEDIAGHAEDFVRGFSDFNLCIDAWQAQASGVVTAEEAPGQNPVIAISGDDTGSLLESLASLLDSDMGLSVNYRGASGEPVGRMVESVQVGQQTIILSQQRMKTY